MVKVSKRRQSRGGGLLKKQGTLLGSSQFDDDDSDTENYMNENEENVQNASRNSNANAEATAGTGKDGSKESVSPGPEKEKSEKSGKDKSGRRRSAGGRRRSSFGGARFQNDEEQQRCVAAYTSIIKMSSENKINDKNSWNLDLIDNMGKLIKSDSNKRGVNFQKASCTIDASVKIYSHRVDDTYTHSHRVLESFSRNDTNRHNDDSDDENNGDVTKSKTASRVGGTKASNRHGLVETIEKSVENINAKEIEHEVQLDPMFHTISKLFDKGGSDGMLMLNLRVNPNSSAMALSQDGLPNPLTGKVDGTEEIDMDLMIALEAAQEKEEKALKALETVVEVEKEGSDMTMDIDGETGIPASIGDGAVATDSVEGEGEKVIEMELEKDQDHEKEKEAMAEGSKGSKGSKSFSLLDLTAMISASDLSLDTLLDASICPQLDVYRSQIFKGQAQEGAAIPSMESINMEPTAADLEIGAVDLGTLDVRDFAGVRYMTTTASSSTLFNATPTVAGGEGLGHKDSRGSYGSRDFTAIPFAGMSAKEKENTLANSSHIFHNKHSKDTPTTTTKSNVFGMEGSGHHQGNMDLEEEIPAFDACEDNYVDMGGDDDDHDFGNNDMDDPLEMDDCDEEGNYIASERRASMAEPGALGRQSMLRKSILRKSLAPGSQEEEAILAVPTVKKISWEAISGDNDLNEEQLLNGKDSDVGISIPSSVVLGAAGAANVGASEYSFFDMNTLMTMTGAANGNNWAGAKHWKWGTNKMQTRTNNKSSKKDLNDNDNDEDGDGETEIAASSEGKKKVTKKKAKVGVEIDFSIIDSKDFVKEELFKIPQGKTNNNNSALMTDAAVMKQNEAAKAGEYFLPEDAKIAPRDLCRLFLSPRTIVPPKALAHMLQMQPVSVAGEKKGKEDVIWGAEITRATGQTADGVFVANADALNEGVYEDYGDAGEDCDYDDDRFFVGGEGEDGVGQSVGNIDSENQIEEQGEGNMTMNRTRAVSFAEPTKAAGEKGGLEIDESKLVQVSRKVEKLNIGYSTVAKKINVKQLKVDIWQELSNLAGVQREIDASVGRGSNASDANGDHDSAPPAADFHATNVVVADKKKRNSSSAGLDDIVPEEKMSFQHMVNDLAKGQKQKDVSCSYYFICLLHLANEKILRIEDNLDMDDLIITKE